VGTAVDTNVMHCPNNGLVDTFYFRSQLLIFETLRSLPDSVRVIAKLHQSDSASRELLSSPIYRRIQIEAKRLEDVLDEADLFIIDFPSTTLLSCCSTQAEIFVLVEPGVTALTQTQSQLLARRAQVFQSADILAHALRARCSELSGHQTPKISGVTD